MHGVSMCVPLSEPGVVSDLMLIDSQLQEINIEWSEPSEPNGVITMYSIRYQQNGNIFTEKNTTQTQYSIQGLIHNTQYTIEVRAHTSVGPGEWTGIQASTDPIRKPPVCPPLL